MVAMVSGIVLLVHGAERAATNPAESERCVLVELFTSQGCNLCPEAERLLGTMADRSVRIVPLAFHVDYFNDPWRDPYSDRAHSERQLRYHHIYPGPKPAEYGLYYTPMLMIDGAYTANGRDRTAAEAAMRQALKRPPAVTLRPILRLQDSPDRVELEVGVRARLPLATGRQVTISAVIREDGITNRVAAGENADRTLVARFVARRHLQQEVILTGEREEIRRLNLPVDSGWNTNRLRVVVFAQDQGSGIVHQAAELPWPTPSPNEASSQEEAAGTARRTAAAAR